MGADSVVRLFKIIFMLIMCVALLSIFNLYRINRVDTMMRQLGYYNHNVILIEKEK